MPEFDSTIRFKNVEGFPGYMVGSDGSVWSCWKMIGLGWRYGTRCELGKDWHRLNPGRGHRGHLIITLCPGRKTRMVHRLVLEAFVGNRPFGMDCRHFPDRDPSNNNLSNLQWGTKKANQADRVVHGTDCRGVKSPLAKLNEEDIHEIRAMSRCGEKQRDIAKKKGVSQRLVWNIVNGVTWKHIKVRGVGPSLEALSEGESAQSSTGQSP